MKILILFMILICQYVKTSPMDKIFEERIQESNSLSQPIHDQKHQTILLSQKKINEYKYLFGMPELNLGQCWDGAGIQYNLDPWLLMAFAKKESNFNPTSKNLNKDQSIDYGLMQINSIHLSFLRSMNISINDLMNPCVNIYVGAFLIRKSINKYGFNIDGLGGYHSNTPTKRREYGLDVSKKYSTILHDFRQID